MRNILNKVLNKLLTRARNSKSIRKRILTLLVKINNSSYHWISFFSSHSGIHPKHKIMNYHNFFLENIKEGDRVLDIGTGNGDVAFDISKKASEVLGIDISKKNIETANKNHQSSNLKFILADARTFKPEHNFDTIILSNVLEHIKNRMEFLRKISGFSPKILIRVPLITRDWISVYKKDNNFPYKLDNTHEIEYTEEEFKKEMDKSGLKLEKFFVKYGELYAVCFTNNK